MRIVFSIFLVTTLAVGQVNEAPKTPRAVTNKAEPVSAAPLPVQADTPQSWGLLPPGEDPQNRLFLPFAKHLVQDQKQFWTYPFHAQRSDAKYILPFAAITGALIASDSWMSRQVPDSPGKLKRSNDFSNYALIGLIGAAGTTYLWGHLKGNDHASEAGLLAGEAAINSTAITYALKEMTQRTRPLDGNGTAGFFQGGGSFPSEHAAIAWSTASVLAHEYPGTLPKLFFYGLASGVTISRVTAKQHFSSDVVVGSALGWYIGRQVYRAHHDPEVGGTGWGSSASEPSVHEKTTSGHGGSSFVPVDSWVYPAFERLTAWGYVHTEMLGMRPWTRSECARLLDEASALVPSDTSSGGEVVQVYEALQKEFSPELEGANAGPRVRVDSLYTRVTGISGTPVNDSYNFGSTIINDDGRPYQEGGNVYSGASADGTAGPFAFYLRAEYQHSPAAAAEPLQAQQAIASQLGVNFVPQTGMAGIDRPRIAEGYVSLGFHGVQLSFGKQSLWWGPTEAGPFIWSTNAEAIPMFRISSSTFKLPGFLGWLGPMRTESFLGQLDGQRYIVTTNGSIGPTPFRPQPFIHGEKLSFKLTSNMELGFSRTVIFSGLGHPFTFRSFWRSLTAFRKGNKNDTPADDVGDSRTGFDFSYRIPHLRKYLTFYTDSFCDDDPSPLGNSPSRCAWSPGLYLSKFPGLSKLDFRAEGITTDVSNFQGTGINYTNGIYPSGYTNNGNILGSWVGREGRGLQLWSTYWLSPQSKIQAQYRHQGVNPDFLKGGWLDDLSVKTDVPFHREMVFSGTLQYEKWNFPLLASETKSNVAVSLSLTYHPQWHLGH